MSNHPAKPSQPLAPAPRPMAPADAEPGGGVIAVTRALQVLEAFALGESSLPLAELSRRCGLHKTTVLRLARTLAQSGFLVPRQDGGWRPCPGGRRRFLGARRKGAGLPWACGRPAGAAPPPPNGRRPAAGQRIAGPC